MKNNKNSKKAKSLSDKLIKNKEQRFDNRFKLTPKGILLIALSRYYTPKNKNVMKNFDMFIAELLQQLSMLVTDNESKDVFGIEFNEFFKIAIEAINKSAQLEQLIHEAGFDIVEDKGDDYEEAEEVEEDEEDDDDVQRWT